MMIDPSYDPRIAGQIERYHTWPRILKQSVGEHTWQFIRILYTVWPDVPREIILWVMFHDVGEMAGDIPFPWKLRVPDLGAGMRKAEAMVTTKMFIDWDMVEIPGLGAQDKIICKSCEYIEMWEWALHESSLGNKYAELVVQRTYSGYLELRHQVFDANIKKRFETYITTRRGFYNV